MEHQLYPHMGVGAAVEFLKDKYDIFLARPNDPEDLIQKYKNLKEYKKLKEYKEYLIKKNKNYNIERSAKKYIEAINRADRIEEIDGYKL